MKARVRKRGSSAAIRIPAGVLEATRFEVYEPADVREESGRIVSEPVHCKEYELSELVKGITAKNQHEEVDFG